MKCVTYSRYSAGEPSSFSHYFCIQYTPLSTYFDHQTEMELIHEPDRTDIEPVSQHR